MSFRTINPGTGKKVSGVIASITVTRKEGAGGVAHVARLRVRLGHDVTDALGWASGQTVELKVGEGEDLGLMNLTKDQIAGVASRLGLPRRPSPIIRKGSAPVVRLTTARNEQEAKKRASQRTKVIYERDGQSALCTCQWPFGDPGTPNFRFCGSPHVVPGRPYCAEHCARAYVACGSAKVGGAAA